MTNSERLAQIALMAREAGRFHIPINNPTGEESARKIYWRVMQPIIAAATSCRLFELPQLKREHMAPSAASRTTGRHLVRTRGRTEVQGRDPNSTRARPV